MAEVSTSEVQEKWFNRGKTSILNTAVCNFTALRPLQFQVFKLDPFPSNAFTSPKQQIKTSKIEDLLMCLCTEIGSIVSHFNSAQILILVFHFNLNWFNKNRIWV
jgi:hypothetical protein